MHVVSVKGGKVHSMMPGMEDDPFPLCRTGEQAWGGTFYTTTDAPLSCKTCTMYAERRELAATFGEGESEDMAKTETVTEANKRMREEVAANTERVRSLAEAENVDAVAELTEETNEIIKQLPAKERSKLTQALKEAGQAEPKPEAKVSKEVVSKETTDYHEIDGAEELVTMGAERVSEGVRLHVKTSTLARDVASVIFDIRRRISNKDGYPDLTARSDAAKKAASAIYDRAGTMLGEAEDMDEFDVDAAAKKLRKGVQNVMSDVAAEYLRGLDDDNKEAASERALFTGITGENPSGPVSTLVANHYGLKLKGHYELMREKYHEKKALEASQTEGTSEESTEEDDSEEDTTPDERVQTAVTKLWRQVSQIHREDFENASEETKAEVRERVEALKKATTDMLAAIL